MKKKLLIGIALLGFATVLQANPLVPPPALTISELMFDSNGNWVLEIETEEYYVGQGLDSLVIMTSTGRAKINQYNYDEGIIVIRNENLSSDLVLRQAGDSIYVVGYRGGGIDYGNYFPLIYGDFATAKVRSPQTGESISKIHVSNIVNGNFRVVYSIDKSPTIGIKNDRDDNDGMLGTVSGKIYIDNQLFLRYIELLTLDYELNFYPSDVDGSYSSLSYSSHSHIDRIYHYERAGAYYKITGGWTISPPLDFVMEPDAVFENIDIHLVNHFELDIKDLKDDTDTPFKISPNPVKGNYFDYEVGLPVKSTNTFIEILSLNGQKAAQYPVTENKGRIQLPSGVSQGVYIVRLVVNNKNYAATKIVISEE
jgi:hypothetical protein